MGKGSFSNYPEDLAPDNFWGQVLRTVKGKPVSETQIQMIVNQIERQLELNKEDVLLDLGCGNGALSARLVDKVKKIYGVDQSKYLIEIAAEYFGSPKISFTQADMIGFIEEAAYNKPKEFTKCLCYGAFQYLSTPEASRVLHLLYEYFPSISLVFLGNLPNKTHATAFFKDRENSTYSLDDSNSPIGVWRTVNEMIGLTNGAGWFPIFTTMPPDFYCSYYRYDVVLTRRKLDDQI